MAGNTGVTIRIVSNKLPQIAAGMEPTVKRIVAAHAYDLEARAKGLAPVRTGTLRRSIHTVFRDGGLTALVGPSVLYGKFVEFGTRKRAARPYMRPAAEFVMPRFLAAVKTAVAHLGAGFKADGPGV